MAALDPDKLRVTFETLRKYIDDSGYGKLVSDARLHELTALIVQALADNDSGVTI